MTVSVPSHCTEQCDTKLLFLLFLYMLLYYIFKLSSSPQLTTSNYPLCGYYKDNFTSFPHFGGSKMND